MLKECRGVGVVVEVVGEEAAAAASSCRFLGGEWLGWTLAILSLAVSPDHLSPMRLWFLLRCVLIVDWRWKSASLSQNPSLSQVYVVNKS